MWIGGCWHRQVRLARAVLANMELQAKLWEPWPEENQFRLQRRRNVPSAVRTCREMRWPARDAERITTRAGERRRGATTASGLPEAEFDYEEFVRQEFGSGSKPSAMKLGWWITAILLVVVFLAGWFYATYR